MARQKAFEPDRALEDALQLFWRQGYEATSMSDLVAHLGLSRSSIYDTFGDKRQLYLAALDRYCERAHNSIVALLQNAPSVRESLRQLLTSATDSLLSDGDALCSCFMLNASVELADSDPEVEARFKQLAHKNKVVLVEAIAAGQGRGEIANRHAATAIAEHVLNAVRGIRVIPKRTADRHALEGLVQTTLAILV